MNKNFLFALDAGTEEVIVSDSPKGSTKIHFIERISRTDHEVLYHAVATLTAITQSPHFDAAVFKAMDKVCQMIYEKYRQTQ